MRVPRRLLLQIGGFATLSGLSLTPVRAAAIDDQMADRGLGDAAAPVRVDEYYSLTCPHCAAFSMRTLPQVRKELIDTGKLRLVFHDFPLDQLALTAAMIARYLPPERYEPFTAALLASQDRWAFARGVDSTNELWKMAALAGLSRDTFNAAIADTALKTAILKAQAEAQKMYQVDSTPTFIFNGPKAKNLKEAGDISYAGFAKLAAQAAG